MTIKQLLNTSQDTNKDTLIQIRICSRKKANWVELAKSAQISLSRLIELAVDEITSNK